jgi:hypothetical protein
MMSSSWQQFLNHDSVAVIVLDSISVLVKSLRAATRVLAAVSTHSLALHLLNLEH